MKVPKARTEAAMKTSLLIPATLLLGALLLSACQGASDGAPSDPERYKRSHDRYMDSYEPKAGGPG
jgi:predicted small secreted protein